MNVQKGLIRKSKLKDIINVKNVMLIAKHVKIKEITII
jgi:hypothetical protein